LLGQRGGKRNLPLLRREQEKGKGASTSPPPIRTGRRRETPPPFSLKERDEGKEKFFFVSRVPERERKESTSSFPLGEQRGELFEGVSFSFSFFSFSAVFLKASDRTFPYERGGKKGEKGP